MIKAFKSGGAIQKLATVILGIAVLAYTVYHISSLFGEDIATMATGVSTERTVIDAKGYIFRDETVLCSENLGVADYLKADGAKVSVGDELAVVHADGDDSAKSLLRLLDKRIAILEQSVRSGATLADLPSINGDISDAYYSLIRALATGDTGVISDQSDKLLMNMNKHSLLTDPETAVDDSLNAMIAQRESILKNGGDSITEHCEDSGYFYSYVDGRESVFSISAAEQMTAESFHNLTGDGFLTQSIDEGAYGKLSESSEWRFVVKISSVFEGYFKQGEQYEFTFVENGNTIVPMTLTTVIDDTVQGGKILVFATDRLPDGFVFGRCQSVSVEVSSISGIYVPKSAVYRRGGSYCVYVLRGSVVCYRRVEVLYEGSDYFLCDPQPDDKEHNDYLGANELLIISGSNLFDGRILD